MPWQVLFYSILKSFSIFEWLTFESQLISMIKATMRHRTGRNALLLAVPQFRSQPCTCRIHATYICLVTVFSPQKRGMVVRVKPVCVYVSLYDSYEDLYESAEKSVISHDNAQMILVT